jgi:hypothetical protein
MAHNAWTFSTRINPDANLVSTFFLRGVEDVRLPTRSTQRPELPLENFSELLIRQSILTLHILLTIYPSCLPVSHRTFCEPLAHEQQRGLPGLLTALLLLDSKALRLLNAQTPSTPPTKSHPENLLAERMRGSLHSPLLKRPAGRRPSRSN